jgi:hypothetical protein
MAFTELNQHLTLRTPFGKARCWAIIDYGQEEDLVFVCIQQDGEHLGEIWSWPNQKVRADSNVTMGRRLPKDQNDCHCGKDGHALNSINCPVHGTAQDQ